MAHEKFSDQGIATALNVSVPTIERTREKFVLGGLDYALKTHARVRRARWMASKKRSWLRWLCSTPPQGHSCWTMQLLADKLLEREVIEQPLSAEASQNK